MAVQQQDKIEKAVLVRAPLARVWRAISDSQELGKWFQVKAGGEFRPGARVPMTSTYPGYEGVEFFVDIEEVDPERNRLSWRWHPGGKGLASLDEPTTLVVFQLEDTEGGTLVKVTESGFERISVERRAKAFEGNERGWELQTQAIQKYVET